MCKYFPECDLDEVRRMLIERKAEAHRHCTRRSIMTRLDCSVLLTVAPACSGSAVPKTTKTLRIIQYSFCFDWSAHQCFGVLSFPFTYSVAVCFYIFVAVTLVLFWWKERNSPTSILKKDVQWISDFCLFDDKPVLRIPRWAALTSPSRHEV